MAKLMRTKLPVVELHEVVQVVRVVLFDFTAVGCGNGRYVVLYAPLRREVEDRVGIIPSRCC